jgi:hypothetical protein
LQLDLQCAQVSVLLGGSESTEFWFYIGGFGEVSRSGTMGEAALKAGLPSPRAAQSELSARDQRPRVAVIGGGVAGCAAANFLQRNNVTCFLFEVHSALLLPRLPCYISLFDPLFTQSLPPLLMRSANRRLAASWRPSTRSSSHFQAPRPHCFVQSPPALPRKCSEWFHPESTCE